MALRFRDISAESSIAEESTWRSAKKMASSGVDARPLETIDAVVQTTERKDAEVRGCGN